MNYIEEKIADGLVQHYLDLFDQPASRHVYEGLIRGVFHGTLTTYKQQLRKEVEGMQKIHADTDRQNMGYNRALNDILSLLSDKGV